MKNKVKIIIVGAGITGSTIANILAKNGFEVDIYEKRNHIAGNMYDHKLNGILVHKYGPHIFHTSKQNVIDFISQFWELNNFKNVVEGYVDNKLVPIPFNFKSIDICFPDQSEQIKEKLLELYPNKASIPILDLMKSNDELIKKLANFVYENLFLNYTTKMWNLKPNEIDASVTARIPIVLSYENKYFSDSYEGLPKDGYTTAFNKMHDHPNIKVHLNQDINSQFKFNKNKIYLNNENEIVVYTGPLDDLFNHQYGSLDYRSLHFEFEILNKTKFQNTAVVNYPADPKMTRITEYKNMTQQEVNDITVISKEFPGKFDKNDQMFSEPYYPLATQEAREKYSKYFDLAKQYENLYLCGRMAKYKYINMDQAIDDSLNVANQILAKLKCSN